MENGKLEYKDSTRCTDCAEKFIRDRQRTADCGLFLGEVPLKPLSSLSLNYFFSAGCEKIGQIMATVRLCCAAALRLPADFLTISFVRLLNCAHITEHSAQILKIFDLHSPIIGCAKHLRQPVHAARYFEQF